VCRKGRHEQRKEGLALSSPHDEDARMIEHPETWPGQFLPVIRRTGEGLPECGIIAPVRGDWVGVRVHLGNLAELAMKHHGGPLVTLREVLDPLEHITYESADAAVAAGWEID
jgi:hypothetical protein